MKASHWLPLLLLVTVVGCGKAPSPTSEPDDHGHDHGDENGAVTLDNEQKSIAGIEIERVSVQTVQSTFTVPGTVTSTTQGRAVVTPPVAGRLIRLTVKPGDTVRQGQVIGLVESTELAEAWGRITDAEQNRNDAQAAVTDAESQRRIAVSRVASARDMLDNQRELARSGAFSQPSLQAAQSELNDAEGALQSIRQELATHTEQLRRLESLYADGLVSRVEVENARLDVRQDEVQVEHSQARVDLARTALTREQQIAERGLLNAREVLAAEADLRAARLDQQRSEAALVSARSRLNNARQAVANARTTYRTYTGGAAATAGRVNLVAPISGTVTDLQATIGQAVDRTQPVGTIENLDSVWVTANVPEQQAERLRVGATVRVTTRAFPDRTFEGVVQVVGGRLDPESRTVPVQCLVTGSRGSLKPEMTATVELSFGRAIDRLAVRETALITENGTTYLFVAQDDKFVRRTVKVGDKAGGYVTVLEGLEEGEQVAVKGAFVLKSELVKDELKGHEH